MPIRKVMEALWMVRQFPRQIRRDLHRFHKLKIADWWRGTRGADGELILSSDELIDYLEWMDDEGAFKTAAFRGGRWPSWKAMLAEAVNEAYRFRSQWLGSKVEGGMFDTKEFEFVDPVIRKLRAEHEAERDKAGQGSLDEFEQSQGFS